jgi:hypothetical protein
MRVVRENVCITVGCVMRIGLIVGVFGRRRIVWSQVNIEIKILIERLRIVIVPSCKLIAII